MLQTTLANIIANRCKATQNVRFVKLSATMVGVNDVKQVVAVAKNEQKFNRKTILFMDEIHRFNKLQQVCATIFLLWGRSYLRDIFSGHFSAARRKRNHYVDWCDDGKSIIQFELGAAQPLPCHCVGEIECREYFRNPSTIAESVRGSPIEQ